MAKKLTAKDWDDIVATMRQDQADAKARDDKAAADRAEAGAAEQAREFRQGHLREMDFGREDHDE